MFMIHVFNKWKKIYEGLSKDPWGDGGRILEQWRTLLIDRLLFRVLRTSSALSLQGVLANAFAHIPKTARCLKT